MIQKKITLKSIPDGAITSIKISSSFYSRLNKLLSQYSESNGKEGLIQALIAIKHGKTEKKDFYYNVETLIILMKSIDDAYTEDGVIKEEEVEVEVPDEFDNPELKN